MEPHRAEVTLHKIPSEDILLFQVMEKTRIRFILMTIVHGDFHGHNILVDRDGKNYYFLDFQLTGFGHLFLDFFKLELSLRYDLFSSSEYQENERLTGSNSEDTNSKGLKLLIRLERALINSTIHNEDVKDPMISNNFNDSRFYKAFKLVSRIRELAFENYRQKKRNDPNMVKHYYMGLVFHALTGLKYFFPLDVRLHKLIIAGMYLEEVQKMK